MQRRFLPQLFISEPSPASPSEPSPVPVIQYKDGHVAVKEGQNIQRQRSIDETLHTAAQEDARTSDVDDMTSTPSSGDSSEQKNTGVEKAGTRPHVASLMQSQPRTSKVSGIKAAFERSNRRVASNSTKSQHSPTKKHDSLTEEKTVALTEELEKERNARKQLEQRCAALESRTEDLQSELNKKDAYWREELAKKVHEAKQESNGPTRGLHSSRGRGRLGDPESHGLQRQLTDLKRSISKSTRVETMVTADSTFKQEMGSLAHEVQNWAVNNYRRARISASAEELTARLVPLANERQLDRLKPIWAGWRPENKIAVLQSTVAAIMMDIFDDQQLFGMPPQEEWAMSLRKTANHMSAVLEPQHYCKWRATTLEIVRQTSAMRVAADSAARTMAEYITMALDSLAGMPSNDTKLASLQPIVRRSITIAHLFRIQRARFEVDLPLPSRPFDPSLMENVAFDRDAEPSHPIDCATFPMVVKVGDENGENTQWQNVVLKANVVCGET